jgi:hypothetical protein
VIFKSAEAVTMLNQREHVFPTMVAKGCILKLNEMEFGNLNIELLWRIILNVNFSRGK